MNQVKEKMHHTKLLKRPANPNKKRKNTGYQITQSLLFPIKKKTKKKTRVPRSRMNEEEEEEIPKIGHRQVSLDLCKT
jgi:hypothetical protein